MISVGRRFAIFINTSEGKTEAMIHLVGPTAKDTLSALFMTMHPDAPRHLLGLLELHQDQHIGLVSSYKHLGAKAAPTMQPAQGHLSKTSTQGSLGRSLCLGPSRQKKTGPWLPQPASQRAPYMAQEHGRNTLLARAEPSTRLIWLPFKRLRLGGSSIVGLCGLPKAWHPYPRHRPGSPSSLALFGP